MHWLLELAYIGKGLYKAYKNSQTENNSIVKPSSDTISRKKIIEVKVKEIITEKLCVKESLITPESLFTDDLGADSHDLVELVMALESAFQISIPDEDAERITNVEALINYINIKLSDSEDEAVDYDGFECECGNSLEGHEIYCPSCKKRINW